MNRPPNSALSFTLAALSVALAAGQSQQNPLIGRWRSTAVSSAGVSTIFEFHSDSQMDSYSAAIVDEKYRLVGTDTILLQSGNGHEEKQEVEWDSQDRARIEDEAAGKLMELVRLGKIPDRKNPMVGEWSTTREWNGKKYPARALFLPDGRVLWTTILRADRGRFSAEGANLRLEISGRPAVVGNYSITGDSLTLPNPRGGGSSFERF